MASEDVIHSFYVPAFRSSRTSVPGRYTTIWFEATRRGDTTSSAPSTAARCTPG